MRACGSMANATDAVMRIETLQPPPNRIAAATLVTVIGVAASLAASGTEKPQVVVKLMLLAPLIEELFFRAVVQRALLERWPARPVLANGLTALAFGVAHLAYAPLPHALAVIAPALAIGLVYQRCRALAPCIALHAAFNAAWLLWNAR